MITIQRTASCRTSSAALLSYLHFTSLFSPSLLSFLLSSPPFLSYLFFPPSSAPPTLSRSFPVHFTLHNNLLVVNYSTVPLKLSPPSFQILLSIHFISFFFTLLISFCNIVMWWVYLTISNPLPTLKKSKIPNAAPAWGAQCSSKAMYVSTGIIVTVTSHSKKDGLLRLSLLVLLWHRVGR